MRVLFGMILGAFLIVGVAYAVDTWTGGPTGANGAAEHRAMVNWDVVGDNIRVVRQHAHDVWTKLSQKVAS
jgi:hypothetical protein